MPLFTGNWFGFGAATGAEESTAFSATGGDLSPQSGTAPGNGYRYHSFGSQGTFTVTGDPHPGVDILCVGGGGSGGARNTGGSDGGGGGGGGGYVLATGVPLSPGTYTVTVGAGGEGSYPSPNGPTPNDYFGEDSKFSDSPTNDGPLIIVGGGGGGGGSGPQRGPVGAGNGCGGGSGGGGGSPPGGVPGGEGQQPTQTQTGISPPQFTQAGKDGGDGDHNAPHVGAGGGGTAENGSQRNQPNNTNGGPGGSGVQLPAWTGPLIGAPTLNPFNGYYGGGGGGGSGGVAGSPATPGGTGGSGGGGNAPPGQGPTQPTFNGVPGGQYVGGGGGSGSGYNVGSPSGSGGAGGDGGTGIVVIRYTI